MYFSNISSMISRFFLTVIMARIVGPENFGLIQLAITAVSFVALFLDFRMDEALIKFLSEYYTTGDKASVKTLIRVSYSVNLVLSTLCLCLLYWSAPFIADHFFHNPQESSLIRVYALGVIFTFFHETGSAILQSLKKFKVCSIMTFCSSVVRFIVPCLCIPYGLKAIMMGYSISMMFSMCMVVTVSTKYIAQYLKDSGPATPYLQQIKRIAHFVMHSTISSTFKSILVYIDVLILGYYRTPEEVGYYKFALAFTSIFGFINTPINVVLYPTLSTLWARKDITTYKKIIFKITKYKMLVFIPCAVLLVMFCPMIIKLTVKETYLPAQTAIDLIIWAVIMVHILSWIKPVLLTWEKPQVSTLGNFVIVCLMVVLSFLLVPGSGVRGAALSYLVSYVLGMTFFLFIVLRLSKSQIARQTV